MKVTKVDLQSKPILHDDLWSAKKPLLWHRSNEGNTGGRNLRQRWAVSHPARQYSGRLVNPHPARQYSGRLVNPHPARQYSGRFLQVMSQRPVPLKLGGTRKPAALKVRRHSGGQLSSRKHLYYSKLRLQDRLRRHSPHTLRPILVSPQKG